MKMQRTGYTLLGLLATALTVMSCTTILGVDTETVDNPCSVPDLPPLRCGEGACRKILPACVNGLPQACPPLDSTADEICDGIDNNCDGLIDEGCPCMDGVVQNCYSGAPLTRNVGVCVTGIQTCTNGVWGDCTNEVLPELENCNDDFDNDCNGAVNDGELCPCTDKQTHPCYGGPPNTQNVSNCRGGTQTCANGVWGDCKSDVVPGNEICDGIDNDCDGNPDNKLGTAEPIEGCDCSGTDTTECFTGDEALLGVGVCKKGYFPCRSGHFDTMKCLGEVLPGAEICNGLDDDCNGIRDDVGEVGTMCTTGLSGLCTSGKFLCSYNSTKMMFELTCTPDTMPIAEIECNLVDENCDGTVDEGTGCCPNDNIQNGNESDVNCGQGCPQQCPDGKKCATGADCVSQVCASGSCVASKCTDGVQNGTETDIDCGGPTCPGCQTDQKCDFPSDCQSSVCGLNGRCRAPTCVDGVQNGQESDTDCGQTCGPTKLCVNMQTCNMPADCQSLSCRNNICQASTCNDGTKNATETDVDCGGGQCQGCDFNQGCNTGSDCKEKVCGTNLKCSAPTCTDMAANGQETDVDCGGPVCARRCDTNQICVAATDCISKICTAGQCAPSTCSDGVKNGTETDVDCGGSCATKCSPMQTCMAANDCTSDVCTAGICQAPTCSDGKKNSTETDIDCGGICVNEGKKCGDGSPCTSPNDCQSGVCPTGTRICSNPQCNDQTKNGTETDIDCGGTACQKCEIGKTCIGGGDCQTGICMAGRCVPKPNGSSCTVSTECLSNFCVDGVCCNEACTDTCKACTAAKKGNGQDGVCGTVISGNDPDNECATDAPTTCGKTGFCNGAGACQNYDTMTECVSATCKDAVTRQLPRYCNGTGACLTSMEQSCVPYICQASACLTACNTDAQCAGGYYCSNNTCVPKKADGGACTFSNECANANCVDSVCCNNACTGACQACSAGKKGGGVDGVCGPIGNNLDPDDECAATMSSTCGTTGACDGAGRCAQWAPGTACASATCVNSTTLSPSSTCNGTGTCTATMQISCVPFICQSNACLTSCMSDTSCSTGNYCLMSNCVPKKIDGAVCAGGNECASGNCVDGVCCNNACTGLCQACSAGKKGSGADGTCGNIGDNRDPDNECMDGQCANTTTLNVTQVCNGMGVCRVGMTQTCSPYVCANGPSCPTTCISDMNCQATHYCNASSQCVVKKATGQMCGGANECSSGFCADGYCCNSACTQVCTSCGLAGQLGTCTNIPINQTDTNPVCGGTDVCNGSGVCKKGIGQSCMVAGDCASNNCVDLVCCDTACGSTCNACTLAKKGSGPDGTCGPIATGQDPDNECTNGSCNGASACKLDLGFTCAVNGDCLSGFCADNVCCNSACGTTCQACTLAKKGSGTDGMCGPINSGLDPDNECTNGSCNGASVCKLDQGATCAQPTDCLSGFCTDNVCCDTACGAACNACSAAKKGQGTNGTCGPIITNTDPDNECTNGSCDGNSQCKLDNGASCNFPIECLSSFCVDGVCCNSDCIGTCNACSAALKGQGTSGTCGPIITNTDPQDECTNGSCDGASGCKLDQGATCAQPTDCLSGFCVDNVCCNNACTGTCNACSAALKGQGMSGTCGPIITATDPENECTNGSCNGASACKLDQGATCAQPTDCLSGFCADGVCCNSACTTQCMACNNTGSEGSCSNIAIGGQDPTSTPACSMGNACDGAGVCKLANGSVCGTDGTICASGNCVDGVCCGAASCGTCQTCNKNMMFAGSCQNIDAGLGDPDSCTGMMTCNGMGSCVALKANGQSCMAPGECATNNCVDTVCCSSSCTTECQSCNVSGSEGTCSNIPDGQTDTSPACNTNGQTCNGSGVCRRPDGAACTAANQCVSGVCMTTCQVPTCTDTVKNGTETATDCGGSCPVKCALSQACISGSDCASGNCVGGLCAASACTDGAQNGDETDVDCGGSCATKCADGQACAMDTDCVNATCSRGLCVNTLCRNGTLDMANGETAIDCGGSNCQICPTVIALTTQGATSPYNVEYGVFNGTSWSGATHVSTTAAAAAPSIAITKTRYAVGVVRKSDDTLASMRWFGTVNGWAVGLTNLPGNPKADGNPATSAYGSFVETAFRNQGSAGKYHTARYVGATSTWNTLFQQTGAPAGAMVYDVDFFHRDPFGVAVLSYHDAGTADPFVQFRTNNSWSTAAATFAATAATVPPNVVQLGNNDLLLTYINTADSNKVYFSRFNGTMWSPPVVARYNMMSMSNDRIQTTSRHGLVVMPNGNVIIVYANTADSGKLYAAIYDTAMNAWNTAATLVTAGAATAIVAAPGLPGFDVEVMCKEGTTLRHARRSSTSPFAWSFPTISGLASTNIQGIGVASFR